MIDDSEDKSERVSIPSDFFSTETGKPFTHCKSCERNLLNADVHYVVEKAITSNKKYNTTDTIFEYALCYSCYQTTLKSMSDTSIRNIQNYFIEHGERIQQRIMDFLQGKAKVNDLIDFCAIKGTARKDLTEYQIACHCIGENINSAYPPLMIGYEAMDEMMGLLSDKTLGEIDRFYNDIIDIPPEFRDILIDRPVFIL